METENKDMHSTDAEVYHNRSGKAMGGLIIVAVGVVLLARQMGVYIPQWVFTWPMLLLTFGLFIGVKHSFRHRGWLMMVMVGGLFLADRIWPEITLSKYVWPIAIIAVGLLLIFSPKRKRYYRKDRWKKWDKHCHSFPEQTFTEDWLDSVTIFGGTKKNIISKDFKGGEVTCVFGGAEINLSQADINGKVILEITQVFGGTKLVVPPHWQISTEVDNIFGGLDDKRSGRKDIIYDTNKTLVIKGTCIFAGVDIRSF